MASDSTTDTLQQNARALAELIALAGALVTLVTNSRIRARKSAIKVRGGRARARNAPRDERGRFLSARDR